MRLLHTHSLEIHFFPASIPAYAILSHTWEQDEVTFQEALCPDGPVKSKLGYEKLQKAADLAAQDGFEYIWIDTCCIDKTSSSELSEAINSMYRWYQKSSVCYAFLSDVQYCASSNTLVQPDIRNSKWFLRGWTLQELIAPSTLVFYSREWKEIGTKSSLRATISQITGIPEPVLLGEKIGNYSVAQRMSWASRRRTTRVEDIAYCLMGIFGITMPMLYGEGTRSFRRLQEEIMRQSDDQSIFAWRRDVLTAQYYSGSGVLAHAPVQFEGSGTIARGSAMYQDLKKRVTFESTNKGLKLCLPCYKRSAPGIPDDIPTYLAVLDCHDENKDHRLALGIWIILNEPPEQFVRSLPNELVSVPLPNWWKRMPKIKHIYVQQHDIPSSQEHVEDFNRSNLESNSCILRWEGLRKRGFVASTPSRGPLSHSESESFLLQDPMITFQNGQEVAFVLILENHRGSLQGSIQLADKRHPTRGLESVSDMVKKGGDGISDRLTLALPKPNLEIVVKIKKEIVWPNFMAATVVYVAARETEGTTEKIS